MFSCATAVLSITLPERLLRATQFPLEEDFIIENEVLFELKPRFFTLRDIWSVGKGDGVYLEILHDNRLVKDWDFLKSWVEQASIN